MSITGQSAKAKGSRAEKTAAAMLGGKRSPLSGGAGGGDLWFEPGNIFGDSFVFEVKARARLPILLTEAMKQAAMGCTGNKKPAVIYKQDRGEILVAFRLADLVQFCTALAEVGNGYAIKNHLRQARKELDAAEGLV